MIMRCQLAILAIILVIIALVPTMIIHVFRANLTVIDPLSTANVSATIIITKTG